MNPEDIASRLDERFRLLTGGQHAIEVSHIRRSEQLLAWTVHLVRKPWVSGTNWEELLHGWGVGTWSE